MSNVIRFCAPSSLSAIAETSTQFMEDVTFTVVTREQQTKKKVIDKVHIPGAKNLAVNFDQRCDSVQLDRQLLSLHVLCFGGLQLLCR